MSQEGGGRIRLRYLELHNYRKFRHAAVEFPDGVIGIIGPNGVGKSTLIEAISWALYGNDAQRTSKEEVRWTGASPGDECSVILEFEMDGDHYRVYREMRGKDLKMKVTLDINNQLHADGDRAVTQVLAERLGMDYKAFFISVFARQKDLDALSILPPGERRQLILRMLDIDVLDRIISSIRADRSGLESQVRAYSELLLDGEGKDRSQTMMTEIEEIDRVVVVHRNELVSVQAEREQVDKQIAELKEMRDGLASIESDFHRIQRELAGKKSYLQGLEEQKKSMLAERISLETLNGELEDLGKKSELLERSIKEKETMEGARTSYHEIVSIKHRLESLREQISTVKEKMVRSQEMIASIGNPEVSIPKVNGSQKEAEDSISRIKGKISELSAEARGKARERDEIRAKRDDINRLGPESSCPTCERKLEDQHQFLLDKMAIEIEKFEERVSDLAEEKSRLEIDLEKEKKRKDVLESRLENLRASQLELTKVREALRGYDSKMTELNDEVSRLVSRLEEIGEVTFNEKTYEDIKGQIDELRGPARRYGEIRVRLERLPRLSEEIVGLDQTIGDQKSHMENLAIELESIGYDEEKLASLREMYENLLSSKDKLGARISELKGEIRVLDGKKESLKSDLKMMKEKVRLKKEYESKISTMTTLANLMVDFKSNLISRIVPTLSEISSSLFNEMTESKYGGMEIDKDYNVFIFDGGEKFRLERYSGGEGDLANLCLRLAISRAIADRSGSSVDFLILDEIFGSQDQTRKRNILSTLNRLSNKFKQIVLITHIDDVKEFMGNVIYVKEGEDGSSGLVLET
ncbi:MAG: SMC family ATPase [Methanomassiliicoccales archaeon]|nr:SMC family ATPase [Methanomassiliicoccales archaeon]